MQALGELAGASHAPKNHKDLVSEQKYLYHMLNSYQPEGGINQMYIKWNIDSTGRKRKQQLCEVLFAHPKDLKQSMESAELVCRLVGVYQACEEGARKTKYTHKTFLDFVELSRAQLATNVNNRRGCVLL